MTKKMVLKKYNVTMEKEKEGVVPNIYFLCRCLSVTESVDGFYCACGRKLSFAAQGKGKKTVVYCISVIHRNSDHYIDRYGAFLQGDSDSLPAQYRNGCSVFWKKFVAYVFRKLGSHLSDGHFPWRGYGIIEKQCNRNDIFLDSGGYCGTGAVGGHMVSRAQKTVWKPAFSGDISASGACDGDYGVLGQWKPAARSVQSQTGVHLKQTYGCKDPESEKGQGAFYPLLFSGTEGGASAGDRDHMHKNSEWKEQSRDKTGSGWNCK